MSRRSHAICNPCWDKRVEGLRSPVVIIDRVVETCCFCGVDTGSGIYVRDDPDQAHCAHTGEATSDD